MACHEAGEVGAGVGPGCVLLQEAVEVAHHGAHPVEVLRGDAGDSLLQPLEVVLEELLAELVGERVEGVPRIGVHELVVAQASEPAGHVGRQLVEPLPTLLRRPAQDPLPHPRLVLARARRRVADLLLHLGQAPRDPGPLLLDDRVESCRHVVEHAVEVGALQLLGATRAKLLDDSPQPRHVAPARAAHPALHEALEGTPDVALGQDVVREGVEDIVRVERRQALAAVPAGVAIEAHRR